MYTNEAMYCQPTCNQMCNQGRTACLQKWKHTAISLVILHEWHFYLKLVQDQKFTRILPSILGIHLFLSKCQGPILIGTASTRHFYFIYLLSLEIKTIARDTGSMTSPSMMEWEFVMLQLFGGHPHPFK